MLEHSLSIVSMFSSMLGESEISHTRLKTPTFLIKRFKKIFVDLYVLALHNFEGCLPLQPSLEWAFCVWNCTEHYINYFKSYVKKLKALILLLFHSAAVTAVFLMDDGTEKRFTRSVQGSSADYRIDREVCSTQRVKTQRMLEQTPWNSMPLLAFWYSTW